MSSSRLLDSHIRNGIQDHFENPFSLREKVRMRGIKSSVFIDFDPLTPPSPGGRGSKSGAGSRSMDNPEGYRNFKYVWLALALAFMITRPAFAVDSPIVMSEKQQKDYGIAVAIPEPAAQAYGGRLPAKVVVPNAQLRVVSAMQGGTVEVLLVAVGDQVQAGQLLARIQSPELIELQRELLQAQTQLHLAKRNLDRDTLLYGDGIIPERRLQETRGSYEELRTVQEARRQSLALAGMSGQAITELESGRRLMSTLEVRSPLDGVVLDQMAVAGQRVEAVTPLYRVGDLDPLWLEIHAPIEKAARIAVGDPVLISAHGISGRVSTIGRDVHEADQGVLVRAEVVEGTEHLRPGEFAEVQIATLEGSEERYRVARTAVVHARGKAFVFMKTEDGFSPHEVSVAADEGEHLIIVARLPRATPIAVTGSAALKAALSDATSE